MSDDPLSNITNSIPPDKLEAMRGEMVDFQASGAKHVEAATKFQAGLDKVIDVLLVLVMKFGRATSVLVLGGIVLVISLVVLVVSTIQIVQLRSDVRDLLDRQEAFAQSQDRVEKTTHETQEKVESTGKAVEATQEKVEASTPKIEVDVRTGKAKLVVPAQAPKPATSSSPAAEGTRKLEIKLE